MCMDKGEQNDNGWRRTDFLASPFTKYEAIKFVLMGYVKEKYGVGPRNTSVSTFLFFFNVHGTVHR